MRTINITLIFLLSLSFTLSYGQSLRLDWVVTSGNSNTYEGYSVTTDRLGNVYVTGQYGGTVDFDPSPATFSLTSNGSFDIFIQKLDPNGNLIWAKSVGGTTWDQGKGISVDTFGNVYVSGYYEGTADFNPHSFGTYNLTSNGLTDIFVLKLDSSGDFVWAKSMGSGSHDRGFSIASSPSGNVYTTGFYGNSTDFDPSSSSYILTPNGIRDFFIQKLNSNGDFVWAKSIGGTSWDEGRAIAIDSVENVYVTGLFGDSVDFNPDTMNFYLTTNGDDNIFVLKLDSSANFVWAKEMGGPGADFGRGITVDNQSNVYTTGFHSSTADFNPDDNTSFYLTATGVQNIFIQKLDSNGDFVWAKSVGSADYDSGRSIAVDEYGDVYITGDYMGTADFDAGGSHYYMTSNGGVDAFILKLNTMGAFIFAKSVGGLGATAYGRGITVDFLGNVCLTGGFYNTVDFDPGPLVYVINGFNNAGIFVQKLNPCTPSYSTDSILSCTAYTWIDGNTYTTNNDTVTHVLLNFAGCDSIITLNLIIDSVDTSLTYTEPNIFVNTAATSYQWLNCDSSYVPITGEISQNYIPLTTGSYAVEITNQNGCIDTSSCVVVSTIVGHDVYSSGQSVSVFPSPTKGQLNINLNTPNSDIRVFTIHGKLIYQQKSIPTPSHQIEINGDAGVYILEISTQYQKYRLKLLKIDN